MTERPVTMARIYLREGEHVLHKLVKYLHEQAPVAGFTVQRGILGSGSSGDLHPSSLLDLSLDLPLVVEFFDTPERVESVLAEVARQFSLSHVVSWPAVSHRTHHQLKESK